MSVLSDFLDGAGRVVAKPFQWLGARLGLTTPRGTRLITPLRAKLRYQPGEKGNPLFMVDDNSSTWFEFEAYEINRVQPVKNTEGCYFYAGDGSREDILSLINPDKFEFNFSVDGLSRAGTFLQVAGGSANYTGTPQRLGGGLSNFLRAQIAQQRLQQQFLAQQTTEEGLEFAEEGLKFTAVYSFDGAKHISYLKLVPSDGLPYSAAISSILIHKSDDTQYSLPLPTEQLDRPLEITLEEPILAKSIKFELVQPRSYATLAAHKFLARRTSRREDILGFCVVGLHYRFDRVQTPLERAPDAPRITGILEELAGLNKFTRVFVDLFNSRTYRIDSEDFVYGDDIFLSKRWAIGLKEMSAYSAVYSETGTFFSKPIDFGASIKRVALKADCVIPNGCSCEFFLSADGNSWTSVKPDGTQSIPLNGNRAVYVKGVLSRPASLAALTPKINWYEVQGIAL